MDFHTARRIFERNSAKLRTTPPHPTLSHVTAAVPVRAAASPAPLASASPSLPPLSASPASHASPTSPPSPASAASPISPASPASPASPTSRASPPSPSPPPSPSSPALLSPPSSPSLRRRTSLASSIPRSPSPRPPSPRSSRTSSSYSAVGDYAADDEFYVPGANDAAPTPLISTTVTAASAALPDTSPDAASDEQDEQDGAALVRQTSTFSRLSAQSWLTVDSAQEVSATAAALAVLSRPVSPPGGVQFTRPRSFLKHSPEETSPSNFPAALDHHPPTLFGVDDHADILASLHAARLPSLSVLECCALLQAGVPAYKKKSFRRFGARRVWLSPDCTAMFWTSKKPGVPADHVKLQKVVKLRVADRELCLEITDGYRLALLFANPDESALWARALSCLVPLQARVRAPKGIIPADKDREDYSLVDDTFNGRLLREYMAVNSYVVLCAARSQPQSMGNKLAFSRSDDSFCGLRYVPRKLVPLLLRSQEEIAVLKRLSHPSILKYHECLLDRDHGGNYVVFEHLARGSLMDASRLENVKPIPENAARELIRDVINGLEYLHSLRIAHGDVRPDNILRTVDGFVKLNPLGCITHDFTEIKDIGALMEARLGDAAPAFLAPELCWLSEAPVAHAKSYAMDVWSVGAVLYFMLYGRVPFGGTDDESIQNSICTGKLRFPRLPETSRQVRSLLKGVLGEKDPKTRIALSELRQHPWFSINEAGIPVMDDVQQPARLIVSPEEVESAVQVAKVRVVSRR